ncbi:MAG: PHP domain-containing protein [Eubacteriales bacterium]
MKNCYKGNLHMHTSRSDGALSPEEAVEKYRAAGYDFLAVTDHWKLSENGCVNGVTLLSGCEFDFGSDPREGVYHVVGVGFASDPGITRGDTPAEAIEKIHRAGGVADIAHPAWSMNTLEQLKNASAADYTEIYNSVSDFPRNCRAYSGNIVDICAANGLDFKLAAVDDTHWYGTEFAKSFIYLSADECTPEAIINAVRNGDFYASQGPHLSVVRDGDSIVVECPAEDEVEMITYFTDTVWENRRSEVGKNLTKAVHKLSGRETFVRVEVRNSRGEVGWSQIIRIK